MTTSSEQGEQKDSGRKTKTLIAERKGTLNMAKNVQEQYFGTTEKVPEETWYWASLGSVAGSMALFLAGKKDWSLFVGQWAPTFLLLGLYHKLLKPAH